MAEILTNEQIANIFKEIDTNNDGFITRQDLEATNYAISLFESTPSAFNVQYVWVRVLEVSMMGRWTWKILLFWFTVLDISSKI